MSHPEQIAFLASVVRRNRSIVQGGSILEIGAFDVNGSMRRIFREASTYIGVDLVDGPGVDVVQYGHEFVAPPGSFDVAVSGECFEHDPHWPETLTTMTLLTRPGGLVAFTCAGRGRPEHGTRRTDARDSPGTQHHGQDYYRNLSASDVEQRLDLPAVFSRWGFGYMPTSFDLYFCGIRSGSTEGEPSAQLPTSADVAEIATLMPLPHRIVRLPLRALMRLTSDDSYQDYASRYWQFMDRTTRRLLKTSRRGATIP